MKRGRSGPAELLGFWTFARISEALRTRAGPVYASAKSSRGVLTSHPGFSWRLLRILVIQPTKNFPSPTRANYIKYGDAVSFKPRKRPDRFRLPVDLPKLSPRSATSFEPLCSIPQRHITVRSSTVPVPVGAANLVRIRT